MRIWLPRSWRRAIDEFELMEEPSEEATIEALLALPYPLRLHVVLTIGEDWREAGIPTFWMPASWRRSYVAYERNMVVDDHDQSLWDAMPLPLRVVLCSTCGLLDALYELHAPTGRAYEQFKGRTVPRVIRFNARYEITQELEWLAQEYPDGVPVGQVLALAEHFDPRCREG